MKAHRTITFLTISALLIAVYSLWTAKATTDPPTLHGFDRVILAKGVTPTSRALAQVAARRTQARDGRATQRYGGA